MTHFISSNHPRPFQGRLLVAATLVALVPQPLPAQQPEAAGEVRIALTGTDAQSLARVRRHVAVAADTLCGSGGIASIYGNAKRRCREHVVADANRQIEARIAPRLAARAGR
jgi:UrcA family protein